MSPSQLLSEVNTKLDAATDHFRNELQKIRTGRAHPGMLDGIMVEAYGQPMPLKSVASVATPEPQLLQITPFDTANLKSIADAIRSKQELGLTPTDDGRVVRITIPPLTTESRQQMVKVVNQKLEESLISARNARHEVFKKGDQAEKSGDISKDDRQRLEKQIDEALTKQKAEVESLAKAKETEITTL